MILGECWLHSTKFCCAIFVILYNYDEKIHQVCLMYIHMYQCTLGTGILYFIDIGQWGTLLVSVLNSWALNIYICTLHDYSQSDWNSLVCKGRQLHLQYPEQVNVPFEYIACNSLKNWQLFPKRLCRLGLLFVVLFFIHIFWLINFCCQFNSFNNQMWNLFLRKKLFISFIFPMSLMFSIWKKSCEREKSLYQSC